MVLRVAALPKQNMSTKVGAQARKAVLRLRLRGPSGFEAGRDRTVCLPMATPSYRTTVLQTNVSLLSKLSRKISPGGGSSKPRMTMSSMCQPSSVTVPAMRVAFDVSFSPRYNIRARVSRGNQYRVTTVTHGAAAADAI